MGSAFTGFSAWLSVYLKLPEQKMTEIQGYSCCRSLSSGARTPPELIWTPRGDIPMRGHFPSCFASPLPKLQDTFPLCLSPSCKLRRMWASHAIECAHRLVRVTLPRSLGTWWSVSMSRRMLTGWVRVRQGCLSISLFPGPGAVLTTAQ